MKKKRLQFQGFALLLLMLPVIRAAAVDWYVAPEAPWRDTAWPERLLLTFSAEQVAGDLTDFPLLVRMKRGDLRSMANGGLMGREDGGDIMFTAGDGLTPLNYEIEKSTTKLKNMIRLRAN